MRKTLEQLEFEVRPRGTRGAVAKRTGGLELTRGAFVNHENLAASSARKFPRPIFLF